MQEYNALTGSIEMISIGTSYTPGLGRAVSSPGNSLGIFGVETTGNTLGNLLAEMLKKQ